MKTAARTDGPAQMFGRVGRIRRHYLRIAPACVTHYCEPRAKFLGHHDADPRVRIGHLQWFQQKTLDKRLEITSDGPRNNFADNVPPAVGR